MGEYAAWYVDGMRHWPSIRSRRVPTVAELTGRPATTFARVGRAAHADTVPLGGNPIWSPPWARVEFLLGTGSRANGVWGNWQPDWFWSS